ncbi:hypothetical protein [Modestobacter lapidis]
MTQHQWTGEEIAALVAMDGKPVTVIGNPELVEGPDGEPVGVASEVWEPTVFFVPWGAPGFPERPTVDDEFGGAE